MTAPHIINLTERDDEPHYVEIITRGGVVRVMTNLSGIGRDGQAHEMVKVDVMLSTRTMPRSGDGGHWEAIVRDGSSTTEVSLIRAGGI